MPDTTQFAVNAADPAVLEDPTIAWAIGKLDRATPGTSAAQSPVAIRLALDASDGYRADRDEAGMVITGGAAAVGHALTDLAMAVESGTPPADAAQALAGRAETPAVAIRSIARSFSSVDRDLAWFHDREFWTEYLDWLAQSRFSQFHLALGMQYNYGADRHGATDNYLCFAYPFLLDLDGWEVSAEGVDAEERDRNLATLQYISAETKRRGMSFQLGLWNHAYDYGRDSEHWYPIKGLTPETHAEYSGAALTELLTRCPAIDGLTFRVHYEGGIHDHEHEKFWEKVFAGASAAGRPLMIDMHAKGVDQALIDAVNKPNLTPVLSAKYWAEHQGLPYHQASIRRREEAKPVPPGHEMKAITEFSRRFTRYGYADFLAEDRQTDLIFRVWPGTQKLLLWGDPAQAAGYSRLSTFGGSLGVDVCEPLYFSGRKGSGKQGTRDPYVDPELQLDGHEWRKYRYTYLLWGRLLHNPETAPEVWRRFLRAEYGGAAGAVEGALSPLSRVLPLVTVVHGVGGSNNGNWLEMYVNLPISEKTDPAHYAFDTEAPPVWGTVSPFDPTTFYSINEFASDLIHGSVTARYSPLEVADWIDAMVEAAQPHLEGLRRAPEPDATMRRTLVDCEVLAALGTFFAAKFRAATAYAIFQQAGAVDRLDEALGYYQTARDAYASILDLVDGVYQDDLRFGPEDSEHGHWKSRLPGIDADIANLRVERDSVASNESHAAVPAAPARTAATNVSHTAPVAFERGVPVDLSFSVAPGLKVSRAMLRYRHVDQSKPFEAIQMTEVDGRLAATIGAAYTETNYPLMYFFDIEFEDGTRCFYPGFDTDLANQPYILLHSTAGASA